MSDGIIRIKADPALLARYKRKFDCWMEELYIRLERLYLEGRFKEMADLILERTVFYSHMGEELSTEEDLVIYFKNQKGRAVNRLRFETVCSEVFWVSDQIVREPADSTIDAVGHCIFKYSLIVEERGEILQNCDGSGTGDGKHPSSCEWGN